MGLQLLDENTWQEITKRARKSRRRHVAVAYLGRGANKLLPLGEGDSLVIDMSEGNIKAGLTDPSEIEKYLAKGVDVYSCSNLHAKVYVFDNTAIIGSANVSRNSQSNLVEVCLLCNDRETATRARGFIKSLQVEQITPEYVKRCKKMYKPPKINYRKKTKKPVPLYSPLWVIGVEETDWSDEENKRFEKEKKKAKEEIRRFRGRNSKKYDVTGLRCSGTDKFMQEVKEGDLIIQIWTDSDKVNPPARVIRLYCHRNKRSKKKFVCLEEQKLTKTMTLSKFKKEVKKAGVKIGKSVRRELRSPEKKNLVLGLWS